MRIYPQLRQGFHQRAVQNDEIVSVRLGKAVRDGLAGEADAASERFKKIFTQKLFYAVKRGV